MAGKTEYKNKWQTEKCDRISLGTTKGKKEVIREYAENHGETLNGFINRAIDETMKE